MRNIHKRYISEEYDDDGIISNIKFTVPDNFNFGYDIVDDIGKNDPERRAMVWCDDRGNKRTYTFSDIMKLSNKAANYLRSLGIGKGDPVLLVLKHDPQFWYVIVAIHKLGAVPIPVTSMITKHDAEYRVERSSAKAVICTSRIPGASAAFDGIDLKIKLMSNGCREGWTSLDEGIDKASDVLERVPTSIKDKFLIYFSSGTSGYPKMVLHDYSYPLGHIATAKHWQNVDPEGVHFTIAETGWAKVAWGKIYGQWIMESAVFVYDFMKFEPSDVLTKISEFGITTLCCPPTMFRFFINEGLDKYDLSSLKHSSIAGEALNPDVFENWYKATGLKLMEGFGQSETTAMIMNSLNMEPRPGSMGKPSPQYTVDIVDGNGRSCAPGETGEIVIKVSDDPPGIFREYYRDNEKTEATIYNGYHHTGDVAWKDEDGYYWYVGRNDDVIKSSGYRIGPFEIESVVVRHESVLECAVTGVPDEIRGQVIKATIVLRPGFEGTDDLKKEIQTFVKKETAPYKYPRIVEFVTELPKTVNGKIRRMVIRDK
jgi:Acyl-coenzyme A synthetases/AMP-(fatty) acid ligases